MLNGFIEYCFFIVSIFLPMLPSWDAILRLFCIVISVKGRTKLQQPCIYRDNHLLISFDIDYVLESHKVLRLGKFYDEFVILNMLLLAQHMGRVWKKSIVMLTFWWKKQRFCVDLVRLSLPSTSRNVWRKLFPDDTLNFNLLLGADFKQYFWLILLPYDYSIVT